MKYNKSEVMKRAWELYKSENTNGSFSDCLSWAWREAKRKAKENLGKVAASEFSSR